jgi:hypothetical protein
MRTTLLAYVIAIVGFAMIVAGAWGFSMLLETTNEIVPVSLSDYAIGIEMMAGGLGMVGLAEALRLLLEINVRG